MTREEHIIYLKNLRTALKLANNFSNETMESLDMAIKALEQEDITWIVGNDNVQIAVRNMPVDMMQKINAIIGNKQEPTTKNDKVDCKHTDCKNCVNHKYCDYESNCSEIPKNIPTETLVSLGVYKQVAWERDIAIQQLHELGYEFGQKIEPTTKNDLAVDWESYKDVDGNSLDDLILEVLQNNFDCGNTYGYKVADEIIELLPSVTPQEPILDKIREQIKSHLRGVEITLEVLVEDDPLRPKMEGAKDTLEECMEIIDKAESEDKE